MKKKPKVRYVDMCIYIDEHVYEKDHDIEKIFNYLQSLFYALAFKKKFFTSKKEYENYSLYGATCVYMRLINPKQFLPEDDPKHIAKVKSVLNYIKHVLYPLKVNYQQETFNSVFKENYIGPEIVSSITSDLKDTIDTGTRGLLQADLSNYLITIPKTIKLFLKDSIYANDETILHKLYISVLITLLRTITLSNHNYNRLIKDEEFKLNSEDLIPDMLREEKATSAVAWHLDKGMENYVFVISNNIIKTIIKDIKELIKSYEPSEQMVKDILMSPLSELNEGYEC